MAKRPITLLRYPYLGGILKRRHSPPFVPPILGRDWRSRISHYFLQERRGGMREALKSPLYNPINLLRETQR